MKSSFQLPGLNSLRFYAAFLVIIYHIKTSFVSNNIFQFRNFPILIKSDEAVSFFFVLSGFLITFLLLQERRKTSTIKIKKFYIRRILRIWPLYFFIILIGLASNFILIPVLNDQLHSDFNFFHAIIVYVLFLPNLFNTFFSVGAILNPIWSIGVEEQFYLFWAPIVKFFYERIFYILILIFTLFIIIRLTVSFNPFNFDNRVVKFVYTLRYFYMAAGGIGAYFATKYPEKLKVFIFQSKISQFLHLILLMGYLFFYLYERVPQIHFIFFDIFLSYLFVWIIMNFSLNSSRIFNIGNKYTEWLGKISYGLYMYHMIIITAIVFIIQKQDIMISNSLNLLVVLIIVFLLTIAIAFLSYTLLERKFLRIKKKHQIIST